MRKLKYLILTSSNNSNSVPGLGCLILSYSSCIIIEVKYKRYHMATGVNVVFLWRI